MTELIEALIAAPSCYSGLKDVAQAYLDASEAEKPAAAAALVAELEADVMPVDAVIGFFSSDAGIGHFGAETAAALLKGAQEHKANGGKYCNCPACSAGAAILERKAEL